MDGNPGVPSSSAEIHAVGPCPACGAEDVGTGAFKGASEDSLASLFQVRRCRSCGLGFTFPPPSEDQLAAAYPESYLGDTRRTLEEYLAGTLQTSRSWRRETEKVRFVESHCAGGRILDVGCADGKFLWALSADRWQRWGVERSAETVRIVQERLSDLKLLAGGIFNRDLQESSFDVITLWHVLEHLPEPERTIERLAALLRPEGTLIVVVPNLSSLQARLFGRYWYGLDLPRHLFHYSPATLERLMTGAGLICDERFFFSPDANFHHLKHSFLGWSRGRLGSSVPYYLLKWALFPLQALERITGRYGMLGVLARKRL